MSLTISDYTSDYIISKPEQTLSSYIYNYDVPITNFFIDHNFFVSSGIYGNFFNYDYIDICNNIIIRADSYIQRDISISGNLYCSSLYNYLANQYVTNNTLTESINNINTNVDNKINQTIYSLSGIITLDLLEYTKNTTFYNYQQSNDLNFITLSGSIYNLYTNIQNLNIPVIPSDLVNKITFDLFTNSLSGSILTLANTVNSLNIPVIPSDLVNKTTFDSSVSSLSTSISTVQNNLNTNYSTTSAVNTLISTALSNISLASLNPLYLGGSTGLMLQYDSTNAYIRNLNTGYLYLGVQNTNSIKITNKGLIIGNSSDNISSSITDSQHQSNSLCIVGQGTYPNRSITMWDNVEIRGNQTVTGNQTVSNNQTVNSLQVNNGLIVSGGDCFLSTNQIMTGGYLSSTRFYTNSSTNNNSSLAFKCVTTPMYRKQVNLNIPVSFNLVINAYNLAISNSIYYKLSGLQCKIYKNNTLWLSPIVSARFNDQYSIAIKYENVTLEEYITMAAISFIPTVENATNTYDVYFIPTITISLQLPIGSIFNNYVISAYFNRGINDKTYTETPNTSYSYFFAINYTNPNDYTDPRFSETQSNIPTTVGVIYINELYVRTLRYGTIVSTTAGINTNTSTIDPDNPIFQNLYFNTLTNATPKIEFGYNDSTKAINAGNIIYGGSNSTFDIYGCGSSVGTRNIKLYDNVTINNSLTVNNTVNTINCFTTNLSSTNCITSLFTCDVLTNKNTATLGSVYINNNSGSIIPLNVGKNINDDSINCSGNITTNDIYCSDLYYARSINNVDVIDNLLTISNQIYSLSGLINNFTSGTYNWTGNNNFGGITLFSNTSSTYFYAPPFMSGANITPNTIKDSSLTSNVVLYDSSYITNNNNIITLSGLINNYITSNNNNINSISSRINNYILSNNNIINSLSGIINNAVLLNATQTLTNKTLNDATLNNANLFGASNIEYCTITDLTINGAVSVPTLFCNDSIFSDIKVYDANANMKCNISNDGTIINNGVIVTDSVFTFKNTTGATLFSVDNTGIITAANSPNGSDNSLKLATTSYVNQFGKLDIQNTWSQRQTFDIAPIMSGAQISNGSIPDIALTSNIPRLNGASNVFSNLTVDSQIITSCVFTSATTYVIVSPFYETYCVGPTVNMTITLPVASASNLGIKIVIRRTSGTSTVTVNSADANIYQLNNTVSNVILPGSAYLCYLNSCFLTSTTYAWFVY